MKEPKLGETTVIETVKAFQDANKRANELGLKARITDIDYLAELDDKRFKIEWVKLEPTS